ncbi:MAG: FkbM family methyltransferase [Fibrobacteria bacterium]
MGILKHVLRSIYRSSPKSWVAYLKTKESPEARLSLAEVSRLKSMPRFQPALVPYQGKKLQIVDSASFLFMFQELLGEEIYRFTSGNRTPYILDCGANIGLSILYFKRLFPEAVIVGFEPDPKIFAALKANVDGFGLRGVELVPKAVWSSETTLSFSHEGADGGHIAGPSERKGIIEIKTVRLRDYLDKPVDLLKMDIEGAECEVLRDCREALKRVERLFVEFHSFAGKGQELQSLLTYLNEAGFRYNIQSTGVLSKHPFVARQVHAGMDMQLNIFAYRAD